MEYDAMATWLRTQPALNAAAFTTMDRAMSKESRYRGEVSEGSDPSVV